ncbi:uncharacterized protein LOC117489314 [Trematomus bernacchii]|uniref:uncharacterized protein LOC117489314 n=1 Tax=Trematomus bernacchii TaxID=40690 RepID=UPI00146ECC8B|nr:uncharacterized protein LOC117489314 [Trematomus bernacchii]
MMTSRFVAGASLFAMLIVSMCFLPVQQGSYPGHYGGSKPNTAPNVGLYRQGPSEVSSQPENVSPPGSFYQAGELSTYSQILEQGNSEQETEDLVPPPGPFPPGPFPLGPSQPPPPRSESAGQGYARPSLTSEPRPEANTGGVEVPYRFYDFFFLNGQYPQGTVSFSSDNYEQGRDSFQDVHYLSDYFPNNPAPVQGSQAAAAAPVQNFYAPRIPVKSPLMAGSGRDGAKAASRRGFRQPIRNQAPGYNFGYGGY